MKWISKQCTGFERDVGRCKTSGIPVDPSHGAAMATPLAKAEVSSYRWLPPLQGYEMFVSKVHRLLRGRSVAPRKIDFFRLFRLFVSYKGYKRDERVFVL